MASLATWRRDLDLDRLEDQYKLPRGLMSSLIRHESGGDPTVTSSAGAGGLFQLMPATASQYGADPYDPKQSATAAAKELGSHWKRYEGDLSQTLAAWNWGSGNLQKKGLANAPTETLNFVRNVSSGVGEQYAAAGDSVTDMPRSQGSKTTKPSKPWLDMVPDEPPPEYRTAAPPTGGQSTAPHTAPTATAKPWLDMVPDEPPPEYRTQPAMPPAAAPGAPPAAVAPQTPPAEQQATGPPGAPVQRFDPGQFMREQAPAAVQAMQPPAYKPSGLPPEQQTLSERLAASEAGQNPNAPAGPSLLQRGTQAVQAQVNPPAPAQTLTPEQQKQRALASVDALQAQQPSLTTGRMFGEYDPSRTGKAVPAAVELGQDVAVGMAGASGGFAVAGVPGMVAGPVIAQGALDRARMHLGLRPKEKAVFETGLVDIYQSDLINGGMALFMGIPDLARSALGKTHAGKAMLKANDDTKAAHNAWMESEAARQKAFDEKKVFDRETYDNTIAKRKAAYDAAAQKRNDLIAKDQETFDLATREYQTKKMQRDAEVQDIDAANYYNTRRFEEEQQAYPQVRESQVAQAEAEAVEKAAAPVRAREAEYQERLSTAAADTKAHQEALERAQMLPEMYKPTGDASDIKYKTLRDAGKDESVLPDTSKADLKQFLNEDYKHYLDESNAALPPEVKFHADKLAAIPDGKPVSVLAVHDAMKELGPLTRSKNGDVRRTASVVYGLYADMLEQNPKIAGLARDASQTFKREQAVKELHQRTGIGTEGTLVSRTEQGGYQINTKGLQDRFDKLANNKLFRGAFDDDEWAALTRDIEEFGGTPKMPGRVTPPTREQLTIEPGPAKIPPESPPQMEKVIPYPPELGKEPVLKTKEAPGPFAPEPFEATVPGRTAFKPTPEPTPAEAILPEKPGILKSAIGQGSSIGGMAYMLSRAGASPAMVDNMIMLSLGGLGAGALGSTMDYAVSKALMTQKGRDVLKGAMGQDFKLDPSFLGGLIAVMSAKERAEFVRDMPKEPEQKKGGR